MKAMTDQDDMQADDRELIRAHIMKMMAETAKIHSEASKISSEKAWHPLVAGAGAATAFITVVAAAIGGAIKLLQ